MEHRLGKVLAPGTGLAQRARQLQVELLDAQLAIGEQAPGQVLLGQLAAYFGIEGGGESAEVFLRQR